LILTLVLGELQFVESLVLAEVAGRNLNCHGALVLMLGNTARENLMIFYYTGSSESVTRLAII
jgi:hypothetical protein